MKTTLKTITVLTALSSLLFIGCKKVEKGETGAPGKDGNANVKSVTLSATSWGWNSSQYWRYATWNNVTILDADVINGGAVMLYQSVGSNNYVQLPITQNMGAYVEHDWFQYTTNTISVYIENSDLSDPNPPTFSYKLVCIPKAAKIMHPNINLKNYNEVKEAFDLD